MTFKSVVNIPIAFLKGVTVALVAALIVVVVGTVLFRVFNIVPEGSSELAILLFIWLIYLGAFVAFLKVVTLPSLPSRIGFTAAGWPAFSSFPTQCCSSS